MKLVGGFLWLFLAVFIFIDCKRRRVGIDPMFYVSIICATIWIAP